MGSRMSLNQVQRFVGIRDRGGDWKIIPVNLNVDVGKHCVPHWVTTFQYMGSTYRFLMEGPNGRMLYEEDVEVTDNNTKEVVEEVKVKEVDDLEFKNKQLSQVVGSLSSRVSQLEQIVLQQNKVIISYKKKLDPK